MTGSGNRAIHGSSWLTRNVLFISLSAFFADMGYQAVTAVFPLIIILQYREPVYVYGIILALSYGLGSAFSLLGGRLGDTLGRKRVALAGNLLIPLMSISVLFHDIFILGALFIAGWWARYFRSPVRRAWMVEVSDPSYRSRVFGFLHALDIGGGIIAVSYSVVLVLLNFPLEDIILVTAAPILVSSLMLFLAGTVPHEKYAAFSREEEAKQDGRQPAGRIGNLVFRALMLSATLFGFSYYALGYPIVTVTLAEGSDVYGILTFGIYLTVSAIAGYGLGALRGKRPLRTLWSLGYLVAAISSLVIGASYLFHGGLALFYIGAAGLGFATGSVETFEPVLTAALSRSGRMSTRMGWLSSSRAVGLLVSNTVMGFLFVLGEFDSYLYAALTAGAAAMILLVVETNYGRKLSGIIG